MWTRKSTECGSQYAWRCCTVAGSNPDICPYAAYNTQHGDNEWGCHGTDYTVGYGMTLDACKAACESNAKADWGVGHWDGDCAIARFDHRTDRCIVAPYSTCWGDGAIQDGQSVSQIWRLSTSVGKTACSDCAVGQFGDGSCAACAAGTVVPPDGSHEEPERQPPPVAV